MKTSVHNVAHLLVIIAAFSAGYGQFSTLTSH